MKKIVFFIIFLFLVVVGVSGCTSTVSNTTKHFDNGVIAFDYPSNMEVMRQGTESLWSFNINENSIPICNIAYFEYPYDLNFQKEDLESYLRNNNPSDVVGMNKTTVSGRNAFTVVQKKDNSKMYWTAIDFGNGLIVIKPMGVDNNKEGSEPVYNKTYQLILNSFQIKS